MSKKPQPDNTLPLIIMIAIIFSIIILFFGQHQPNTDIENEANKILDTLR